MSIPVSLFNLKNVDFTSFPPFEMKKDVSISMTREEEELQGVWDCSPQPTHSANIADLKGHDKGIYGKYRKCTC